MQSWTAKKNELWFRLAAFRKAVGFGARNGDAGAIRRPPYRAALEPSKRISREQRAVKTVFRWDFNGQWDTAPQTYKTVKTLFGVVPRKPLQRFRRF